MPELTVKARVAEDDAYRAVLAVGMATMANHVEKIIYSAGSVPELLFELHLLIASARDLAGD
jgi:hypothetical protein